MYEENLQTPIKTGTKESTMPEKLDRCVGDVKGQGKSSDSAWAICTDSMKKEVAEAIGMAESHNPLDIPFGFEVGETHSIGAGLSGTNIKVDNSHSGRDKMNEMSDDVFKQILETQLGECNCKNKSRRKA